MPERALRLGLVKGLPLVEELELVVAPELLLMGCQKHRFCRQMNQCILRRWKPKAMKK
jgi:hypothetical protein